MRLLFDENLSDRIVGQLLDIFPGSTHVKALGMIQTDDQIIWNYASEHGFTLVSKDSDFHQKSLLLGHPPKFVFLRIGNCPTTRIVELIRSHSQTLLAFDADSKTSILILPLFPIG